MPTKEKYCYRILKSYSLLVDFDGQPDRENVPSPLDKNETFGQWKKRVLGANIDGVTVYGPIEVNDRTRINTLQSNFNAEHIGNIFKFQDKVKNKQNKIAVSTAIESTEKKYSTVSKDTLEDLISGYGGILEPSVKEFFDRYLEKTEDGIDAEELIGQLLKSYNDLIRQYRERRN